MSENINNKDQNENDIIKCSGESKNEIKVDEFIANQDPINHDKIVLEDLVNSLNKECSDLEKLSAKLTLRVEGLEAGV